MNKEFVLKQLKSLKSEVDEIFDKIVVTQDGATEEEDKLNQERTYTRILIDLTRRYIRTAEVYIPRNNQELFCEFTDNVKQINERIEKSIDNINQRKELFIGNNNLKLYKIASNIYENYMELYYQLGRFD